MPAITIRDVPEATRNELAARAAASGRSLQEFLRATLVDLATQPDPVALVERIRVRKTATGTRLEAREILEHRDAERG